MSAPKIMVMSPLMPKAQSALDAQFEVFRCDTAADRSAFLRDHGRDCRGVIIKGHDTLGLDELLLLPQLEIVTCSTAGYEAIDDRALRRSGIELTNASLALKDDVADTALMLLLATHKHLLACDTYVRSGAWGEQGPYPLLSSLTGKRVGILGFGVIGQEIAARLKAMKVEIGYCTRRKRNVPLPYFADAGSLADWADVLISVIPGGQETNELVSRNVLTRLGPTGIFINIARGSVVDEAALIDLLKTGALGGAGLDVFQNEPNPDPALTTLKNVVLYPHHASGNVETRGAMAQLAVDNLVAYFHGEPLLSSVNQLVGDEQ